MCARVHVHVRVCDDNYMYKEEWVEGPNTNWRTSHKPRLISKILPSFLGMILEKSGLKKKQAQLAIIDHEFIIVFTSIHTI